MRIERFGVEGFGRLRGLESGPLPGLVVVLGPNEAGKSTLFHFLTSMLYGFYPASREGNPHTPWGGGDAAGTMTVGLDGGGCVEVERRLLSQPTGRMELNGASEELRNRTLPWAEHVPRAVFHQVFAVTHQEMASLDPEAWARVQDRIVGAMGAADLRPAREVAAELEREAGELWRPNRRGNQRAREVARRALALRERRREAAERDHRIRGLVDEAERVRKELAEAREARHATLRAVERIQELLPVRARLERIAELRREAGEEEELSGLPVDPGRRLADLEERVSAARRRLAEARDGRAEPEAAQEAMGPREEGLLGHADEIRGFAARSAALAPERDRLTALAQERRDLERRIEEAARQLLGGPLDPEVAEALGSLSPAVVRERVQVLRQARLDETRARGEGGERATPASADSLSASLVVLLAGVALVVAWATGGGVVAGALGGAVSVVGIVLLVQTLRRPGSGGAPSPSGAEAAAREARDALGRTLAGVPVRDSLLDDPTEALPLAIQRIQELRHDLADREAEGGRIGATLDRADTEAERLATAVGLGTGLGAAELAHLLEQELRRAERLAEGAAAAGRELARLEREEGVARRELEEAEALLSDLRRRLTHLGGGALEAGVAAARRRIQARDRAAQLEDELERNHPDLARMAARIRDDESRGEAWTRDDGELARRKAAVEELSQRVEDLAGRAEALDRDVAHLRAEETVDAVDGEIAALEEAERTLLLERDRRWVMARLLREADRRFREEHQPDVLRRAGEHLAALTGGRYNRLMGGEAEESRGFHLVGPATGEPLPLSPPLSTGTLEQAHLALRLAIVDHLDQGVERLPLFTDEVFSHWDVERRRRGTRLLGALARSRQIFVFTCHGELARELEAEGARILALDRPG